MGSNRYSYEFRPEAESGLDNALLYIRDELRNAQAVKDMIADLFDKIDNLCFFPLSGAKVDNEFIIDQTLRKFFVGKYVVFYKPCEKLQTVVIIRIIYGSRNLDEILNMIG